jgi:murein L,D-transpeptidase YcbB/YkuD
VDGIVGPKTTAAMSTSLQKKSGKISRKTARLKPNLCT